MSSGQECQFHMATWHLVAKNGNFAFLLTCSGQEFQFYITTEIYSCQEWQFHIATDIYWSRMAISHY